MVPVRESPREPDPVRVEVEFHEDGEGLPVDEAPPTSGSAPPDPPRLELQTDRKEAL